MKIYFAANLPNFIGFRKCQADLETLGHVVSNLSDEPAVDLPRKRIQTKNRLMAIKSSDIVVLLPSETSDFEAGYALALGKTVALLGNPQNDFHLTLCHCPTWERFLTHLKPTTFICG